MELLTLRALSGGLGSDEKSEAVLRDFLTSIERDVPSIIETCIERLVLDANGAARAGEQPLDVTGLKRILSDWVHSLRGDPACRHCAVGSSLQHTTAALGSLRQELIATAVSWSEPIEWRMAVIRALNRAIDVEVMLAVREDINKEQLELTGDHCSLELSRLIVSLGHDLRSPLGAIETSAYLIAQRVKRLGIEDVGIAGHVQKVREHVRICSDMISDLVGFASSSTLAPEHRATELQDGKIELRQAGDNEVEQ